MSFDVYWNSRSDKEKIWDLQNEVRNLWRQIDMLNDHIYELENKLREKEKEDGGR